MPENSNLIKSFDSNVIEKIKDAYQSKKTFVSSNGIELFQEPFTHGVFTDLVEDLEFIQELTSEIQSKLKYLEKNNDLYKFHQTSDLSNFKSKNIRKFRDQILYGSVLKLLEKITNIELSSKIDFTSSKYGFTDYLLCHDDDIHDDTNKKGRRIAFIYYLVPEDWSTKDGGNLDLFKVNEHLQPTEITKSIQPKFNSLLFFEVSDRSFHQVAEVLSKNKTRYSINGWFHGDVNLRPDTFIEIVPEPSPYIDIDASLFFEWITEKYLEPINQTKIQLKFSSSSEIKLDKIFNLNKYEQLSDALTSDSIVWEHKGPANRRNYELAVYNSLPQIVIDVIQVLTSDHMGLTLANMTGLGLHSSVPKRNDDDEDDDDLDDSYDDEEDEAIDAANDDNTDDDEEEDDVEPQTDNSQLESESFKRKNDESETKSELENNDCVSSKPGTSQSESNKKFKSENESTATSAGCSSNQAESSDPKCYYEIRRWKQGNYTLVTDDDNQIKTKALDLMLFFKSKSWTIESGGNVSYIARNEDSELLTVNPEENCLALVYRDQETLKFTKCVNSKINELNKNGCFYEISIVYYE